VPGSTSIATEIERFLLFSICHPSISLEHDSYSIALACIYLAVRSAGASLPMELSEVKTKSEQIFPVGYKCWCYIPSNYYVKNPFK